MEGEARFQALSSCKRGGEGAAGPWHASADLSKPTWGAGVGPLSPELLEEQFVLRGLLPGETMDCSLPGSSVRGIFQARVLEWGAITFSSKTH